MIGVSNEPFGDLSVWVKPKVDKVDAFRLSNSSIEEKPRRRRKGVSESIEGLKGSGMAFGIFWLWNAESQRRLTLLTLSLVF